MTPSKATLAREFSEIYPDKKLYGVPNKVFMHYYWRFPYRHCCQIFYGKRNFDGVKDYISIIPLLEQSQEEKIPDDKGLSCKEFIFADDLDMDND